MCPPPIEAARLDVLDALLAGVRHLAERVLPVEQIEKVVDGVLKSCPENPGDGASVLVLDAVLQRVRSCAAAGSLRMQDLESIISDSRLILGGDAPANEAQLEIQPITALTRQADAYAKEHLQVLAAEMIELLDSGVLCQGHLRKLADIVRPLAGDDALRVAQSAVNRAALEYVQRQSTKENLHG